MEMEVVIVKSSDGTICPTEVAAQLSADLVGEGGFKSLLDWAMAKARLSGNLGKRLLLPPSDTPVVLRLLLQQVEKGMNMGLQPLLQGSATPCPRRSIDHIRSLARQ